ncbi:MAG TPA: transglycosylase SLT domain-containing protein [Steroidobacteraceae bacterium]
MRKRWWRAFDRAPRTAQLIVLLAAAATVAVSVNWIYQVIRKPSELFFPVSDTLNKTPAETWRQYSSAFEKFSTSVMSPELLAALAQVEGSGNPVARTYWRWSWTVHPFGVYRPASSAVGMYQLTDGTFEEAKRYCIHDHVVVADSCWFNNLYTRVIPSHSIELTSAYLDRAVVHTLERHHETNATPRQKRELAAVIHLCGAGAGDVFARHHFRLNDGQRCGDHEVRVYVARVNVMENVFSRLAAAGDSDDY